MLLWLILPDQCHWIIVLRQSWFACSEVDGDEAYWVFGAFSRYLCLCLSEILGFLGLRVFYVLSHTSLSVRPPTRKKMYIKYIYIYICVGIHLPFISSEDLINVLCDPKGSPRYPPRPWFLWVPCLLDHPRPLNIPLGPLDPLDHLYYLRGSINCRSLPPGTLKTCALTPWHQLVTSKTFAQITLGPISKHIILPTSSQSKINLHQKSDIFAMALAAVPDDTWFGKLCDCFVGFRRECSVWWVDVVFLCFSYVWPQVFTSLQPFLKGYDLAVWRPEGPTEISF